MSQPIVIALIGIAGAVMGSLAAMTGNVVTYRPKESSESKWEKRG